MKIKKIIITISLLLAVTMFSNMSVNAGSGKAGMKVLPVGESVKLKSIKPIPNTDIYTTIETAADEVREKVTNHASNIKVFFKTTIQSPEKAYEKFKKELTKETDNSSEGDYLYWDIKTEIPKYIYVPVVEKGKVNYYYEFDIYYEYYTTRAQKEKVDATVKSLIKKFGFTSDTTNYEKVKTIYDYVCQNVQYADDISNDIVYTSYSALFDGKAVCQGYAQLIYKMLREVDVSVRLIPGYAGGELHGWNIVKLGGYYYNIDATWDALNYQRGYAYKNFLIGDDFENHVRFDNYSDDEFYSNYPMAKSDYGKGKKTLSVKSQRSKFKMIKPKFVRVKGKKVTLKKVDSGVRYIVQYGTKSNFKGAKRIIRKKRKFNLLKLKKNKKYYVRFRASKVINGKTVYTKWSAKKTIIFE